MSKMKDCFKELGSLGLNRYEGMISEEFLTELQGRRGVETFKEMSENDDILGAILFAVEMLLRQVAWEVHPCSTAQADVKAAEFVRSCMEDMEHTWSEFISEVLTFLTYGWSYHEIVYKRRLGEKEGSRFQDGLIGWKKLPIRSQETLHHWAYGENSDDLVGMVQCTAPDFQQILIPSSKALHFKTKSRKGSPEGRSILRNAYRSWYFKKRIQEIEGIGVERDLAGLPVLEAPEGVNIWEEQERNNLRKAEEIVRSVRRDQREGIVLGGGWKFSLTSTGGSRQFDTCSIIQRYDSRMAMTVLADFVLLGHEKVGSFALSSNKTELFAVALGAFLELICQVMNRQGIPPLMELNRHAFSGMTGFPTLVHGDLETQDLGELGSFLKDMVGIGLMEGDGTLEEYLRRVAGLPRKEGQETL